MSASPRKPNRSPNRSPKGRSAAQEKDLAFLQGINLKSRQEDFKRWLKFLREPVVPFIPEVTRAACQVAARYCQEVVGFERFAKNGGLELLVLVAPKVEQALAQAADEQFLSPGRGTSRSATAAATKEAQMRAIIEVAKDTVKALAQLACSWLSNLDHLEFQEVPGLMAVARWLGSEGPLVGFHALKTLERFALHRSDNCKALLELGAIPMLHQFLGVHRAPELVHESLVVLFRLTDLPGGAAVASVQAEKGIITTIVETLRQADTDLRIQLAGLRLLALWGSQGDHQLRRALAVARAEDVLRRGVQDLLKAGVPHMATWLQTVAARSIPPSVEVSPEPPSGAE